jgi:hypothetical protein
MKLRRGGFLPLGVLLVGVVLATAGSGFATDPPAFTATPHSSCDEDGVPTSGRRYCAVVATYDNVLATYAQKVDIYDVNHDENSLTNPVLTLSWIASAGYTVTSVQPLPSNCTGPVTGPITCTIANVPGVGAKKKNPPPNQSQVVSLFFDTAGGSSSSAVTWTLQSSVNEGPSGEPNQSTRTATGHTTFGQPGVVGPTFDLAAAFGLAGDNVVLGTTGTGTASLKFTASSGTPPFQTFLTANASTSFCFGGVTCLPLELTSSVPPGSVSGILVWHFTVPNGPNNLKVIHRYDPADVPAADPAQDTFSGDFRRIDGARIDGQDYYVRNANGTTFQLSQSKTGNNFYNVTGTVSMSRIRLIGDNMSPPSEVDARCNGSISPSNLPRIPSVNALPGGEVWFCDDGNGGAGPWT